METNIRLNSIAEQQRSNHRIKTNKRDINSNSSNNTTNSSANKRDINSNNSNNNTINSSANKRDINSNNSNNNTTNSSTNKSLKSQTIQSKSDKFKNKSKKERLKQKKGFNNELSFNNNLSEEKCNNNKKTKNNTTTNHKLNAGNNSSNKSNKSDKTKDKDRDKDCFVKTKDLHNININNSINSNKSLNDLLNNTKCVSTNPKKESSFIKEFKFFKEKAKDKLKKSISLATNKSKTTTTSCGTTSSKQELKCDLLSGSGLSDNCGKHNKDSSNKSKVIGLKDVKQWRESSVSSTIAAKSGSSNAISDHKFKVKTSAKNKYNNKFDNNCNNSNHNKTNSSLNKTISQSKSSQSKTSKTKTSTTLTKDKCPKNNGKRNNKFSKKDNILYDEDIIDGFAIFSFRNFHDLELTINKRSGQIDILDNKDKHIKDDSFMSSTVSSSSSSSTSSLCSSSTLKGSNKTTDDKSSKLTASKPSKSGTKEVKSSNKIDAKNAFDSNIPKSSKKKLNENNGNNKNNNKNANNQHKSNNKLNSSKNKSLSTNLTLNKKTSITSNKSEALKKRDNQTDDIDDKISEEGSDFSNSTFGSSNNKEITSISLRRRSKSPSEEPTRITSLQSPSASSNSSVFTTSLSSPSANKVISNTSQENICAKVPSDTSSNNKNNSYISEPSDSSKENKSISFTPLATSSIPSSQKSPSIGVNNSSAHNSSIRDIKVYSAKNLSSAANDNSFSSSSTSCSSSATLPLNSSSIDCESVPFLSHNLIIGHEKDTIDSETSTICSSSETPILKSNHFSTSPSLLTPPIPPPLTSNLNSSLSSNTIGSLSSSTPTKYSGSELTDSLTVNHKSSAQEFEAIVSKNKENSIKRHGTVSFQSHFIESVLRNNQTSDQCNAVNTNKDNINRTNNCYSPTFVEKIENNTNLNNKKNISNTCNSKVSSRSQRTTSPLNKNTNNSSLSNLSKIVKPLVKESLSQSQSVGIKRAASPSLSSNQSTANKQVRQSSPNHIHHFDSRNSPLHQRASTPSIRSISSSLSSLSQLSQSIGGTFNNTKEKDREREGTSSVGAASNRSCGSSRNTPSITAIVSNSSATENTNFTPNFASTKSHLWSSSSNTISSGGINSVSAISHLSSPSLAPRTATPNISLSTSIHNNHLGMFASPIPPAPLSSVGGAAAPSATPSPFIGDSLFSHQNQDFLRQELNTRFLASQDRTINIPPPPYMRAEMHPHIHLQQSQPYGLPPAMGNSLVPPSTPHLYDKFPKLDQAFYGRSALGLPGFPSLSPLLTPGSSSTGPQSGGLTASSSTPFGPPGHLAAFQPKMNSLSNKSKPSAKSGRWCAMHVRIAWEIYHHQQKQQQLDLSHKSGISSSGINASKTGSSAADMLRPLNHLFPLPPRTHEMPPFSSALLSAAGVHAAAAAAATSRASFESQLQSHHNQFGSTTPSPHLSGGTSNFARFSGFGGFSSLGSALSLPPGPTPPTSNTLFGPAAISAARDLPIPGCLPGLSAAVPDLWSRNSNTRSTPALFPPLTTSTSSTSSSNSSWGGLKAEAERDRLHEELYNKRKHTDSTDKDPKRFEKDKSKSEEKTDVKHRDHSHKHSSSSHLSTHLRNGDIYSEHKNKEWVKNSNKRESSRSPIHHSHHSHQTHSSHHNHHHSHSHQTAKISKSEISAFDNNKISSVDVKEEQKEENVSINQSDRERHSKSIIDSGNDGNCKTTAVPTLSTSNLLNPSATLAAMSLNNPLERARLMGLFGLHDTPPPVSPHLSASNANDSLRPYWAPLLQPVGDPFKSLHEFQVRPDFLDRDNIFQRYSLLNSSGGGASLIEKIAKENAEKEMLNHSIERHNSKLSGTQLRSNESNFNSGLPPHNPHTPHMPASHSSSAPTPSSSSSTSNLFPANPYLNSLHSLSTSAGSYVRSTSKTSTPVQTSSSSSSSSEPSSPLAPTNGTLPALIPNVLNHSTNITNSKISINSIVETPLEVIKEISNKNSETNTTSNLSNNGTTNSNSGVEIAETNSR